MSSVPRGERLHRPAVCATAVSKPLAVSVSPVKDYKNKMSKHPMAYHGAEKVKHTRTRSQKNDSCFTENVFVSEEIKSQLKFEVAVSLSTEFSNTKDHIKVTNVGLKPHAAERRVLASVSQNSPIHIGNSDKPGKSQINKKACSSTSIDRATKQGSKTGTTPTAKLKDDKTRVGQLKDGTSKSVQVQLSPAGFSGEKRKRPEIDNHISGSPLAKKRSGDSPLTVTPRNSSKNTGNKTPTAGTPRRLVGTSSGKSQKKNKALNTPNQLGSQPMSNKPDVGLHSQTRSPAFLKRHIHQSPRPEGCMSPKRKPGTPWRECQLRKLAEEQKAADEAVKRLKQKGESSISPPVCSPKSSLPRPDNQIVADENTPSAPNDKQESDPRSVKEETAVDSSASSPVGSDVDQTQTDVTVQSSESTDNASQTLPPKTVLSRIRGKLTMSYERTMEYFQQVKHIWDGDSNC